MPKEIRELSVAVVLFASAMHATAPKSHSPQLPELLKSAGLYLADYANRISGVTLEEHYQLTDVTGGKMQAATRITSDVVFVNLNGGVAALRDPFAVDTNPLRERTPRITVLLATPTATTRDWETVIQFPAQGARYFGIDLILKVNEPTFALRFIGLGVQADLKYSLDGRKKLNGVEAVGIRFEEPAAQDKKYIAGSRGNARASGRIWVDAATGAVHQTELWLDSKADTANITVKYAPYPSVDLLLPSETNETYEERQAPSGPRDFNRGVAGRGGDRISFQASAKYSKPTYTPIDLRTLKK